MNKLFDILYEDAALLALNKPAGLVCHPTKGDAYSSLISRVRLHLGASSHPQIINRLDRETGGITLIAKNSATARELRGLWEQRFVTKKYRAIVYGRVLNEMGVIDAPLGRDTGSQVAIKDRVVQGGLEARTNYRLLKRFSRNEGEFSLLEVEPLTGRKHQIRIHLAHIGHPIVGDKLYGLDEQLYLDFVAYRLTDEQRQRLILPHHALHAREVSLHWRGSDWHWLAEPESWFQAFMKCRSAELLWNTTDLS